MFEDMTNEIMDDVFSDLFEELVPARGKADTVAGEMVRAYCRIDYRYYNDGDRIGVGYGKETCNPAARYLLDVGDADVRNVIDRMWGCRNDKLYFNDLMILGRLILWMFKEHPELKETANDHDMNGYRDPVEDVDDEEEENWW